MNVTVRTPLMTRDQFLDWAERRDAPFEFDGFEPVPMNGTLRHGLLCGNLFAEIRAKLDRKTYTVLLEAGLATVGNAVRYPDLVILPSGGDQNDRLMPNAIVAFEVISPSTGRLGRTTKLREYRSVPSLLRYVIVDSAGPELQVFSRPPGGSDWIATEQLPGEILAIPEIGIEFPVDTIFDGITFD